MDMKTFEYLYYKTRGFARDEIIKEAKLSEDEFSMMEQSLAGVLKEIEADRTRAATIGKDFVRLTRYLYSDRSDQELGLQRPDAVKPRSGEPVAIPAVDQIKMPQIPLHQAIGQRRSLRQYSDKPFTQEELSFLLWTFAWARDFRSNERIEFTMRNVPSAGSRHPFECYLLINNVEGLKPGLYYYHPLKHCLVLADASETIAPRITTGCLGQEMAANSAVTVILTAIPYRTAWRYQQRSYRYLYIDAGHIGQNIHLAAEALDAGACMIGAFQDEEMNDCLGVDGVEEFVIYVAAVGKK
ncbi:MAG: SagB/ThcOx family dehydrogenase [Candidatus Syntrophosphaera sp.]|nr:SagB/ThcOx family dehydrogenase [Candidatus Syntrophosphaera sp.]